jgi:solute carrier family 25 carnitine/acylcarnitine transporter 20/29
MSADFWAGYLSGAVGIIIGNPLDIVKVQLQRPSSETAASPLFRFNDLATLQVLKGTAAPIVGYGALNALMFMTYNRSMAVFAEDPSHPASLGKTWLSGALAGLATFVVSAPTELVKCRAQVGGQSSLDIAKQLWRDGGLKGLYLGGAVTSIRDSVGYGF